MTLNTHRRLAVPSAAAFFAAPFTVPTRGLAVAGAPFATTFKPARPQAGPFRRSAAVAGDLLGAVAIVLCIPLAILALATPLVLVVRLLVWLAGLL